MFENPKVSCSATISQLILKKGYRIHIVFVGDYDVNTGEYRDSQVATLENTQEGVFIIHCPDSVQVNKG